jgi:hypothetical protein
MQMPVDGYVVQTTLQPIIWANQGRGTTIGSSFTTVSGQPSFQLQSSTNTVLGYFSGQMLAYSNGNGTGAFAGQTAGALINFDPASTDTGQAVWNGMVIADAGLHQALPIGYTYPIGATVIASVPNANWSLYVQALYAGGTPATDAAVVRTALNSFARGSYAQVMLPNRTFSTVFNY